MAQSPNEITATEAIYHLGSAGELDAAGDILDLLCTTDPHPPDRATKATLQAQLFDSPEPDDSNRNALIPFASDGALDALTRAGMLHAVVTIWSVLSKRFPDNQAFSLRADSLRDLVSPLPDSLPDSRKSTFHSLLASGNSVEAYALLRDLLRDHPRNTTLSARAELLRELLYARSSTRPYATVSSVAAARILRAPVPTPEQPTPIISHNTALPNTTQDSQTTQDTQDSQATQLRPALEAPGPIFSDEDSTTVKAPSLSSNTPEPRDSVRIHRRRIVRLGTDEN